MTPLIFVGIAFLVIVLALMTVVDMWWGEDE